MTSLPPWTLLFSETLATWCYPIQRINKYFCLCFSLNRPKEKKTTNKFYWESFSIYLCRLRFVTGVPTTGSLMIRLSSAAIMMAGMQKTFSTNISLSIKILVFHFDGASSQKILGIIFLTIGIATKQFLDWPKPLAGSNSVTFENQLILNIQDQS